MKVRNTADIVFLVDATGSMQSCICALKENIKNFFERMTRFDCEAGEPHVEDWRAKVVGFRDFEFDGPEKWFVDNPFTRDMEELRRQFDALEAEGGGDVPESLLDALYRLANMGETERGVEQPGAWRNRRSAARTVFAFTDAPCKPTMNSPGAEGKTVDDLITICEENRIMLMLVAPDNEQCREEFDALDGMIRSQVIRTPCESNGMASRLECFPEDPRLWGAVVGLLRKRICCCCAAL